MKTVDQIISWLERNYLPQDHTIVLTRKKMSLEDMRLYGVQLTPSALQTRSGYVWELGIGFTDRGPSWVIYERTLLRALRKAWRKLKGTTPTLKRLEEQSS